MSAPAVTVIMPTYNRAGYIAESLDAVLNQTVPPSQVIVVNDGSTDDTEAVLAPYMERIEYLRKDNEGKPIALNTAMPMVRGDYVWSMDDDVVAVPEALERHLAILEARPDVGFTYSACYISTTGEDGRIVRGPVSPYYVAGIPEDQVFTRLMDACFLNHPGILVRKSCYDAVGPFDEELIRSQDYDIMLRLARRFTAAEVTEPSYDQRQHQGTRGTGAQAFAAEQAVARWYAFDRHIFAKLHADMALYEYLPKNEQGSGQGNDFDRRAALIKRMSVTGRRGLWDAMTADLAELSRLPADGALSEPERTACRGAVGASWHAAKVLIGEPGALGRVIVACRGPLGQAIRLNMAVGLYYWLPAARKHEGAGTVARLLWATARLIGPGGFGAALRLRGGS